MASRFRLAGDLVAGDGALVYNRKCGRIGNRWVGRLLGARVIGAMEPELIRSLCTLDPAQHLDGVMAHDLEIYLADDVLRKVDMMSMANGLEVRVPLLDHRIVEASVRLSWQSKVSTRATKILMRRLYRDQLPDDVVAGRKRGFSVPVDAWFRGPLREAAMDTLGSAACRQRGVLVPEAVRDMMREHDTGREAHGRMLFTLVALERWLQRFDEVPGAATVPASVPPPKVSVPKGKTPLFA
jgi:asparagine synthase (glutamine-hydrolysing)